MNPYPRRTAINCNLIGFYQRLFRARSRWMVGPLAAASLSYGFSLDDIHATLTALTEDGWLVKHGEWYVATGRFTDETEEGEGEVEHCSLEQSELVKLRQERDAAVTARDKALGERNELLVRAEGAEEKVMELENTLNEYRSAVRRSIEAFAGDYNTAIEIANEFDRAVRV